MALLPPHYLDSIVALGILQQGQPRWGGTGFLLGYPAQPPQTGFFIFLITNRHVFANHQIMQVAFNPKAGASPQVFPLQLRNPQGQPLWLSPQNQSIDLAALPLDGHALQAQNISFSFLQRYTDVIDKAGILATGRTEGDHVFVLGYPLGQIGVQKACPIVRQGCVARMRELVAGATEYFLLDSSIFPGNSGGPVILEPTLISIQGTQPISVAHMIGVVAAYLPYRDRAISEQTGEPRIEFVENSGLSVVYPIDALDTVIKAHLTAPQTPPPPPPTVPTAGPTIPLPPAPQVPTAAPGPT